MFITKKHIPRRTFLRGAGVTFALPLLDSMIPAATLLAPDGREPRRPASSRRFIPHGAAPGYHVPDGLVLPPRRRRRSADRDAVHLQNARTV